MTTTLEIYTTEPVIRRKGGKFAVRLQSRGNPDHGQDPERDVWGVPDVEAHVEDLREARALCEAFIAYFDLGGGNWTGGQVVRVADGLVLGKFSYNGRFWSVNGKEMPL